MERDDLFEFIINCIPHSAGFKLGDFNFHFILLYTNVKIMVFHMSIVRFS